MTSANLTQAVDQLAEPPPADELVVGLVGAVGTDLRAVSDAVSLVLNQFGYRADDLHLSDWLTFLAPQLEVPLTQEPFDERIWTHMSAGNELREKWDRDDAFALLALNDIASARARITNDIDRPAPRQAYIVRSLKRPEEADLLRDVYGSRFILLAAYAPVSVRVETLQRSISDSRLLTDSTPSHTADDLIARDESEDSEHGQAVQKLFHQADFFVDASDPSRVDNTRSSVLRTDLLRIFELVFGHPHRTPSRDEFGMFQAVAASRRSAELGRQVGAAICTEDGDVVAVGANEVPKAGGGQYWEGDEGDAREFHGGRDQSDEQKQRLATQIASALEAAVPPVLRNDSHERVIDLIEHSALDDVTEYVRAVHAEMAAIADAAKRGIPLRGTTLYVTTFPCHHCTRHLVAAGVNRVVYVAPYAKSLAETLHNDSIVVTSRAMPSIAEPDDSKGPAVRFEPFVGVAPTRYLELFEIRQRKDRSTGKLIEFDAKTAPPILADLDRAELRPDLLPYLKRERRANHLLVDIQYDRPPTIGNQATVEPEVP